jgi:hypothetical protein
MNWQPFSFCSVLIFFYSCPTAPLKGGKFSVIMRIFFNMYELAPLQGGWGAEKAGNYGGWFYTGSPYKSNSVDFVMRIL